MLSRRDVRGHAVGGPSDDCDRLADIVQPKTYLDLYHLVAAARGFVGNDTGPTHLAGICGVPTVAIFGSDPVRWSPIASRISVVYREGIDSISTDDVLQAIAQ